jgi:hypothetical protein
LLACTYVARLLCRPDRPRNDAIGRIAPLHLPDFVAVPESGTDRWLSCDTRQSYSWLARKSGLQAAKNAGTTVDQIERFSARNPLLEGDGDFARVSAAREYLHGPDRTSSVERQLAAIYLIGLQS